MTYQIEGKQFVTENEVYVKQRIWLLEIISGYDAMEDGPRDGMTLK